jgi:uncharacterized Fe-S cluster-containing radical SAM superfamily protein
VTVSKFIDTDKFSAELRRRGVDLENRRILVTYFPDSDQAKDFSEPANCNGLGRIRHFRRYAAGEQWRNPLPIDPARAALKMPDVDSVRAQVFQNAICNWRCWYCYVDFELLSANMQHARWVDTDELVSLYSAGASDTPILDLSGGQPDLTPEWIPWTMDSLVRAGLSESVYLWSDDNLSNDYLWRYLTPAQLEQMAAYSNYGRVACFKGIDEKSFSFNTLASPELFDRQFELFERLLNLGLDLYAYVTFTTPSDSALLQVQVARFVDRLQKIHENLPLRTVPLLVDVFTPTRGRLSPAHSMALARQEEVLGHWLRELHSRYYVSQPARICDVPMRKK